MPIMLQGVVGQVPLYSGTSIVVHLECFERVSSALRVLHRHLFLLVFFLGGGGGISSPPQQCTRGIRAVYTFKSKSITMASSTLEADSCIFHQEETCFVKNLKISTFELSPRVACFLATPVDFSPIRCTFLFYFLFSARI